jgi:hypothetical protein
MQFKEEIADYSENYMKRLNKLCEQNAELLNAKTCGIYNNHRAYTVKYTYLNTAIPELRSSRTDIAIPI